MTAIEQFFLVLLFTMLYKMALTFGLWKYNHLNENYVEELPRSPLLLVFLLHSSFKTVNLHQFSFLAFVHSKQAGRQNNWFSTPSK